MAKTVSQRSDGANADIFIPDAIAESYVDGIASVHIGLPNSRIQMYVVSEPATPDNPVEMRRVTSNLVIPTGALVEFIRSFSSGLAQNGPALAQANANFNENLSNLLKSFQPSTEINKTK